MSIEHRTYCLVIKRKNNDYLPVEWNLTKFYQGENLYTLEGIDKFTSKITRKELVTEFFSNSESQIQTALVPLRTPWSLSTGITWYHVTKGLVSEMPE